MSTVVTQTTPVELAARGGGGIDVALFWDRRSGRVWVDVHHVGTGLRVEVGASRENALDVFYHPFAHGAGGLAAPGGLDELAAAAKD